MDADCAGDLAAVDKKKSGNLAAPHEKGYETDVRVVEQALRAAFATLSCDG